MFFEILGICVLITLLMCVIFLLILIVILSYQSAQKRKRPFLRNMKLTHKKLQMKRPLSPTQDRSIFILQCADENNLVKPGILMQRSDSEQAVVMPPDNAEAREEKSKIMGVSKPKWDASPSKKENSKMSEKENSISNPLSTENNRRPIKGVTFSQEVIVVDLGKDNDKPHYYTREHKDKK
ncbi:uncharacterized protein C2orf74 homolog [Antechinus flavipes]|uniref:uncharacterized protein C2orf74 homolog n=1 Tax=Antechinus flavipes TaxID=38775 RepID=UPI00223573F0|nr:uncharacterized protein C2orf74 homolog [Antechinus flavipes]